MRRGARRAVEAALVLAVVASGAACAGGCSGPSCGGPTTPTTTSTTSAPSGPVPLTGGPVLAVKIDNTSSARPRIGLDRADVVYVEPVEGGLTRLLAVFSRHQAPEVGPVRSGRETDVTILAQLGEGRLRLLRLVVLHRQGAGPRGAGEPQQRPVPTGRVATVR